TIGGNIICEVTVYGGYRFYQRIVRTGLCMDRRMQRGHQERSCSSFARYIAERDYQPTVLALDKVVIITADFVTREADPLQLVTRNYWRRRRLEPLLDFHRELELALKPFLL